MTRACGRGHRFGGKGGARKFALGRGGPVAFSTGWRLKLLPRKPRAGGEVLSALGRVQFPLGRQARPRKSLQWVPGLLAESLWECGEAAAPFLGCCGWS